MTSKTLEALRRAVARAKRAHATQPSAKSAQQLSDAEESLRRAFSQQEADLDGTKPPSASSDLQSPVVDSGCTPTNITQSSQQRGSSMLDCNVEGVVNQTLLPGHVRCLLQSKAQCLFEQVSSAASHGAVPSISRAAVHAWVLANPLKAKEFLFIPTKDDHVSQEMTRAALAQWKPVADEASTDEMLELRAFTAQYIAAFRSVHAQVLHRVQMVKRRGVVSGDQKVRSRAAKVPS